eukprot:TRINITY_DN5893_c0_g1_i2.p1 TRINITY_DN5893_c0_g1~~TRINITY_DN5893_c0_g1_i2.p1  ORF type:complete len:891 (+),score=195.86 TRINITY_DN5893_c0_g1_i2:1829-4501(+)
MFHGPIVVSGGGELCLTDCRFPSISVSGKGSYLGMSHCVVDPSLPGFTGPTSSVKFSDGATGLVELCDIRANAASGAGIEVCGGSDPTITACSIRDGQVGLSYWENGQGKLKNCAISNTALVGVEIARSSCPQVSGCRIYGSHGLGVAVHNGGLGAIRNCDIFNNNRGGVDVNGCSSPTLKSCFVHHNQRAGIAFNGASQGLVKQCKVFENDLSGVRIQHGSTPTILRCWVYQNKLPGLVVESDSNATITECIIHSGEQAGLYFCNCGHGTVESCSIYNNALAGVEVATEADPVVRGCTVDGNKKYGVHYRERGSGRLEGCTVARSASINVHVSSGSDPIIRDCRVVDSGGAGVFFNACGAAALECCAISGSGMANVEAAKDCAPTVRSCLIHDGMETGIRFDKGAGGLIELCEVYRNALVGIAVRNAASPIIRKCNIHHGLQSGVLLTSCGMSTVIDSCDIHSNSMGGIELTKDSAPIIRCCSLHHCAFSALQYLDNSGGALMDCKIWGNGTESKPQPGLEVESTGPNIRNCVIDGQSVTSLQQQQQVVTQLNHLRQLFFTFDEIESATSHLDERNTIGTGSYGTVYRGIINGTAVAIKVIHLKTKHKAGGKKGFEHEIQLLSTFRHRNLVPLMGCSIEGEKMALVYDLMEGGSLKDLLKRAHKAWRSRSDKKDLLSWTNRLNIAIGCARGLLFLHATARPPVIHRDFKAANVLLDRHNEPRIGDFGLARLLPETSQQSSSVAGTPGYICPEYDAKGTLSTKVDVWSFGVVLLELLTGQGSRITVGENKKVPLGDWLSASIQQAMQDPSNKNPLAIFVEPDWPEMVAVEFYNIANQCLIPQQAPRPGMTQVLAELEALEGAAHEQLTATTPPTSQTSFVRSHTGDPEKG